MDNRANRKYLEEVLKVPLEDFWKQILVQPEEYLGEVFTKSKLFTLMCLGADPENLIIPEGFIEICDWIFHEEAQIKSVTLPKGMKKIGKYAFYACSNLETIVLPEGLEEIDEFAFENCCRLREISIPDGVKIGDLAFHFCYGLDKSIREQIRKINPSAL